MGAGIGRGITNRQAKYLAALCRELREPYPGSGMTAAEASQAITVREARVTAALYEGKAAEPDPAWQGDQRNRRRTDGASRLAGDDR